MVRLDTESLVNLSMLAEREFREDVPLPHPHVLKEIFISEQRRQALFHIYALA